MRNGKDKHMWDVVAYTLAHHAAFAGSKDVKVENFNPLRNNTNTLTAANLKDSTKHLFTKE